jgi:PAS domain S-box-containing protein
MADETGKFRLPVEGAVESEKFAQTVLNASLNGLYIYDLKLGKNVFINSQYATLTGYTFEDLQTIDSAHFFNLFHPDDRQRVADHMESLVHNSGHMREIEYRFKTKDDRWIWCLSRDSVFARDEKGVVSQFIGTFFDITERKRAEDALQESETRFRNLFETLTQGVVFQIPPYGDIVDANPAAERLLGLSREEMVGRVLKDPAWRMINEDASSHNIDENPALVALRTGKVVRGRVLGVYHPKRKENRWLQVDAVPQFRPGEDQPYMVCVLFTDITDRRTAEDEVRKINRELEQRVKDRTAEIESQYKELEKLHAGIKQLSSKTIEAMETDRKSLSKDLHDSVAGTLAAIKMQLEARLFSAAQNLPSDLMPLEKIVAYLEQAIKETRSISRQLRSLTLDDFGLKAALVEQIQHFKEWYPGIEVVYQIEISEEDIPSDIQTVLYRVVQEALNNVGKHSAAKVVRVNLTNQQEQIWLQVADNGCGFELGKVMSGGQTLMGFGIHSMRERVEICKGKFQIRSEPGSGTTINIAIPA